MYERIPRWYERTLRQEWSRADGAVDIRWSKNLERWVGHLRRGDDVQASLMWGSVGSADDEAALRASMHAFDTSLPLEARADRVRALNDCLQRARDHTTAILLAPHDEAHKRVLARIHAEHALAAKHISRLGRMRASYYATEIE